MPVGQSIFAKLCCYGFFRRNTRAELSESIELPQYSGTTVVANQEEIFVYTGIDPIATLKKQLENKQISISLAIQLMLVSYQEQDVETCSRLMGELNCLIQPSSAAPQSIILLSHLRQQDHSQETENFLQACAEIYYKEAMAHRDPLKNLMLALTMLRDIERLGLVSIQSQDKFLKSDIYFAIRKHIAMASLQDRGVILGDAQVDQNPEELQKMCIQKVLECYGVSKPSRPSNLPNGFKYSKSAKTAMDKHYQTATDNLPALEPDEQVKIYGNISVCFEELGDTRSAQKYADLAKDSKKFQRRSVGCR